MIEQSTLFEQQYIAKVNTFAFLFLGLHLPVLCGIAGYTSESPVAVGAILLVLLLGPGLILLRDRTSPLGAVAIAIAAMGVSALAVHVSGGMIEAHFELFTLIAMLTVYGRVAPLLAAGVTIALHHVLFWLWLPGSVFNYKASFSIVLLHAFFVVLEVVPCCWIARQFGKSIKARGIVVDHLGRAADEVSASAAKITSASNSLADEASNQAATIQQTSASTIELSHISGQNTAASDNALLSMTEMDQQLLNANADLRTMQKVIEDMVHSGREIHKVIQLIDGIAFQTNILSLNAAVEAASAGSYGAGFSVVAKEVGHLAQKSAGAATDTAALIEASLSNTKTGEAAVEALRLAMTQVTTTARTIKTQISALEATAHQHLKNGSQIKQSMRQLGDSSQHTAASAEQTAAAAASLNQQAQNLRSLVAMLAE